MEEESTLRKKMRANPFVPIGIAGLLGIVVYGLYNLKNTKQKTSVYLIHLRLAGQGTVLGVMTIGLLYMLGQRGYSALFSETENKSK